MSCSTTRHGRRCALDLQAAIAAIDWTRRACPSTSRSGSVATSVRSSRLPTRSRPDRLHGVAREPHRPDRASDAAGAVYVTEPFAAALVLDDSREFACDYVGHMDAAKGYGRLRMYRLCAGAIRARARTDVHVWRGSAGLPATRPGSDFGPPPGRQTAPSRDVHRPLGGVCEVVDQQASVGLEHRDRDDVGPLAGTSHRSARCERTSQRVVLPSLDATAISVPSGEKEIPATLPVETWSGGPLRLRVRAFQNRTWPFSVPTARIRESGDMRSRWRGLVSRRERAHARSARPSSRLSKLVQHPSAATSRPSGLK